MTKRELLMKKIGINDADAAEIRGAAYATWQYIGGDVLQAVADEKGISADHATVSRADVMELVLDADRISEQLVRRPLSDAAKAMMRDMYAPGDGRDLIHILVKEAFPYTRYGM